MAESPIQSSFIPHDTVVPSPARFNSRAGLYDLALLIGIVLCIASIVLAAGVFLYQQFLQTESNSKRDQLQRVKAAFEPELIQKLTRLDDRMRSADEILSAHLAPTTFFKVLEAVTLQTVSFDSLNFQARTPAELEIHMTGVAQSVNSIALQADLFSKSSIITDPIFSGIGRQLDGVHFTVQAKVNPALLKYSQFVAGNTNPAAGIVGGTQQQQQISTTTNQAPAQSSPFDRPAAQK